MNTKILDNFQSVKKLDSKNMLGSLESLSQQIDEVGRAVAKVKIQAAYKKIRNIAILGMGGSTLGSHIIKSLFQKELKVSIEIVNGYHVPAWVNADTLVIISSYSGGTEEPLAAMKEAVAKKAKLAVITSGGKLAARAKKHNIPAIIFTTKNNPCGSPRMGLGYSIFGQIMLLAQIGLLKISQQEFVRAAAVIEKYNRLFGVRASKKKNDAKKIAKQIGNRSVWYVASEHLAGSAHTAANQINESAKRLGGYFLIPELNHHLMEGMVHPKNNQRNLAFILLESPLYDKRVQKRYKITGAVMKKNNISNLSYICKEKNKFLQVCEILVLGSYISFYLAMLEGIDPTSTPFVDFFKVQLKK